MIHRMRLHSLYAATVLLIGIPGDAQATWSVLAVDRATGRIVIASATCVSQASLERFPSKGLWDVQAIVAPGFGVAAAQAGVDRSRRNQTLIHDELKKGTHPSVIIQMLMADSSIQTRQFGIVDLRGRFAGFSGGRNGAASLDVQGQVTGTEIYYSIQGNILASNAVVQGAVRAFEATAGSVTDRVMAAMEAADAAGGDRRCSCATPPVPTTTVACTSRTAHVAYLLAADSTDRSGTSYNDRRYALFIDVTDQNIRPNESANPVTTLRMRYDAMKRSPGSDRGSGTAPQPGEQARLRPGQQVIMVTGSTDGLGREVARRLASSGAHIIVHGRNRERGASLVQEIMTEGRGSAAFYPADLASLEQVRSLGAAILRDYQRLDVLVNNAGIYFNQGARQTSADGHEVHFAVNYLSGYLLTRTLLPLLRKSAPSRIVNVASVAQTPIDFSDVMLERNYSGSRAYAQSKLAQILFTIDLATELQGHNVTVNALHPATLMDTPMVQGMGVRPRATVAEGAEAVIQAVTASGLGTGAYFDGKRVARANAQAYDETARARLRELSERLTTKR